MKHYLIAIDVPDEHDPGGVRLARAVLEVMDPDAAPWRPIPGHISHYRNINLGLSIRFLDERDD